MDELVKRLRNRRICVQQSGGLEDFPLLKEAADAIEELSKDRDKWKATAQEERDAYRHWFDQYQKDVPRWIPVTERLPERGQNVIVANKREKQWDIDKAWLSCLGSGFDRCGKRPLYHVTHWMPLPEPPKEEEDADN